MMSGNPSKIFHQQPRPSFYVSLISVLLAALVLTRLSNWHANQTGTPTTPTTTTPSLLPSNTPAIVQRLLLQTQQDHNNKKTIDDDITRDDICRQYLMNFLNGTTDSKDECEAMSKAYTAADCVDYNNNKQQYALDADNDKNNTDDNVMIDDAFEKWECCSSISDFYGKHCQDTRLDATKLLGVVLVLVVCGMMKALLKVMNVQWIPDAGACIVVGALVSGILSLIHSNIVEDDFSFSNELFLQIMLPPIVFAAALSINKRTFCRDLVPILTFAILGTGLSAVGIGYITYALSKLPLLDSLLFGALMSSIDPVATLSILTTVGVSQDDTLYTLVFGESLLNDGVSIVLFESLVKHMGDDLDPATLQDTLLTFVIVTIMSMLIGIMAGGLSCLYFYCLQGKQSAVSEVALFFAWAFVPYYIADGLGFSGIIAIMVMGFTMDYYVIGGNQSEDREWIDYMQMRCDDDDVAQQHHHHPVEPRFDQLKRALCQAFCGRGLIMERSQRHVGFCAEVVSSIMETSIFAYLGLFLFKDRVFDFVLTISGILACVTSRAVMVIVLSLVVNLFVWLDVDGIVRKIWRLCRRRDNSVNDNDSIYSDTQLYLDAKTQLILFSAGVRGAVSYSLVQNIPVYDAVTKHGSHFKGELRSMTSATIVVILFSFGALTYFSVKRDNRSEHRRSDERVAGHLTHRLLNSGLASEAIDEAMAGVNSTFEMEGRALAPSGQFHQQL